jgi:hypothetical protein
MKEHTTMSLRHSTTAALALGLGAAGAGGQCDWTTFTDRTSQRASVAANLFADDDEEKDYAWADSNPGARRNVLLMNEDGILTDRTEDYASASDAPGGDQGFLTATDDRDIVLIDVDGDTWLDMVTAVTYGDTLPKYLSHPRVYMNLGEDGGGNWQGFKYEVDRIPELPIAGFFCGIGYGDVDDDGSPDLFFTDYFNTLEDILLVNDGNGFFSNVTNSAFSGNSGFLSSTFSAHALIIDLNDDGYNDIVKVSALGPYNLKVAYNNPANPGVFSCSNVDVLCGDTNPPCETDAPFNCTDYHVESGDLNHDGRLDLVISDDGSDKVFLNQGNGGDGFANFTNQSLPNSGGFNGNSVIADLNNDTFPDLVITDVDVDLSGCDRDTTLYRNNGNLPNVGFTEDNGGIPNGTQGRQGGHDAAVFDIDQDGFLDIVLGTCFGTKVWMNEPTSSADFDYPAGRPQIVVPGVGATFEVTITPTCQGKVSDAKIFVSINEGAYVPSALTPLGGDSYEATLPASVQCGDHVDYYFSATDSGNEFLDPPSAPLEAYEADAADSVTVLFEDEIEGDVSGWSVVNDPSLTSGAWEQADPNATLSGGGFAQPGDDATPGGTQAFITENCQGSECDSAGTTDVDGGPTDLITPTIDLSGATGARISFARWHYNDDAGTGDEDLLTVSISNDGGSNWVAIPELDTNDSGQVWETVTFLVEDYIPRTDNVRLRFRIADNPNNSIAESGIDDLRIEQLECDGGDPCPWDLDGSGSVGTADLLDLLSQWGTNPGGPPDFDGDGNVGTSDLLEMLSNWGGCP